VRPGSVSRDGPILTSMAANTPWSVNEAIRSPI
jgi:hypothetical protein